MLSDVLFDNFFTDMMFHSKIENSQKEVLHALVRLHEQVQAACSRVEALGAELMQASSALRQRRAELDAYRKSIFDAVTAGRAAPSEASSPEMGPPPAPAGFRAVYEPGLQYGRQVEGMVMPAVEGVTMPGAGGSGRATPPAGFGEHPPAGFGEHPPAGFGEHPPSGFDAPPHAPEGFMSPYASTSPQPSPSYAPPPGSPPAAPEGFMSPYASAGTSYAPPAGPPPSFGALAASSPPPSSPPPQAAAAASPTSPRFAPPAGPPPSFSPPAGPPPGHVAAEPDQAASGSGSTGHASMPSPGSEHPPVEWKSHNPYAAAMFSRARQSSLNVDAGGEWEGRRG
ncbi:uncharacterized protein SCHCODRAFT_02515024 [Schizophyllum commune H4-8]|uniref:uncharacterized protein n=1 Tax=Schizophyllum commune (strain H4-8 / FGSC 9210) TaxID=578458 RepID=UPI00215FD6E9|nr:uncharacterized protein SCHCODRAFT_02515024 [Schizophyllum commune H4-8]KAI5887895.1 hypothetical protein SCHCODRAFT_02515024 [Schizophyllum commune H4-8]